MRGGWQEPALFRRRNRHRRALCRRRRRTPMRRPGRRGDLAAACRRACRLSPIAGGRGACSAPGQHAVFGALAVFPRKSTQENYRAGPEAVDALARGSAPVPCLARSSLMQPDMHVGPATATSIIFGWVGSFRLPISSTYSSGPERTCSRGLYRFSPRRWWRTVSPL